MKKEMTISGIGKIWTVRAAIWHHMEYMKTVYKKCKTDQERALAVDEIQNCEIILKKIDESIM